jgi:hypothetical protein
MDFIKGFIPPAFFALSASGVMMAAFPAHKRSLSRFSYPPHILLPKRCVYDAHSVISSILVAHCILLFIFFPPSSETKNGHN